MPLSLNLPERIPGLSHAVETDPRKLKDWLIALPTAHVLEAGRQILDPLAALNRVQLSVDERVRLLEQYQTSLELLIGGFEAAYAAAGIPMKDKARQAGILARNLWHELALGWKVALVERMEKRSLFGGNKQVPQYVANVLLAYWRLYLVCCRLYMPLPEGVWHEVHQLFMLAAENRYLDEPSEPKNRTIAILYKRFLLLSLVDPMRFSAQEFDRVLDILDHYGHFAHFVPASRQQVGGACFLIELDQDAPPRYIGQRGMDEILGSVILLDTRDLARQLHKAELAVESKAPAANHRERLQEKLEILRRVILQWTIAPHRTFPRLPASSMVDIVQGLRNVSMQLLPGAAETDMQATRWQVLNESPGGYAVRAIQVEDESVRSGQVVAVRPSGATHWQVAVVRWLQQHDDGTVEIGLQVLAMQPNPVMLSPLVEGTGQMAPYALLLPEIPVLKQPQRLISPKGFYMPLREVRLSSTQGDRIVRTGRLIEQQPGYELFEFQWMGE